MSNDTAHHDTAHEPIAALRLARDNLLSLMNAYPDRYPRHAFQGTVDMIVATLARHDISKPQCAACGATEGVRANLLCDLCPACEAGLRAEHATYAEAQRVRLSLDAMCPVPRRRHG